MYAREDRKGLSMKDLIQILQDHRKGGKVDLGAPIEMSSDEEGNEMQSLYGVEVSKSGRITLWPARL